jgi:hypothetical protein
MYYMVNLCLGVGMVFSCVEILFLGLLNMCAKFCRVVCSIGAVVVLYCLIRVIRINRVLIEKVYTLCKLYLNSNPMRESSSASFKTLGSTIQSSKLV